MKKYISYIALVISFIAFAIVLVGNQSSSVGTDVYNTTYQHGINVTESGCYAVDGSCVIDSSGNFDGAITGTTGTFSGAVTLNAGSTHSYLNSTTTADTTQLVSLADIDGYSTVQMTPTVGATTLTFAASTTFATMIPNAGDWFEQVWYNASTTAAQTLTFAAGTGWDLEVSTSSPQGLVIDAEGSARLLYMRGPDPIEDILLQITRFDDAD